MRDIYLPYLDHFSKTSPINELAASNCGDNVIGLRHDVDYSIDIALKMAWLESEHDIRSTYYILHTADYMSDDSIFYKCNQIQSFGHEIGLHTNFLANWFANDGPNPEEALAKVLARFRANGINVTGLAAHGDPACYTGQFTNYWLFKDLEPDNPQMVERNVLAEGIVAPSTRKRFINYPADTNVITRADGEVFPFWSLNLSDFGISYEASRLDQNEYFSDSGGSWLTSDPLKSDLTRGRYQILMHPWHWRGEQKHFYFLATARSGTKWLSQLLNQAGILKAEHEVTLNYGGGNKVKNTNTRLVEILSNENETQDLIAKARERSEEFVLDYAEANIYLPLVIDQLPHGPDTSFIHIVRNPKDVVRSLLQRGWYEVPFDPRHPVIGVDGWDTMSQIEQICWYVRSTHEALLKKRDAKLQFEKMVSDPTYLTKALSQLEIGLCQQSMSKQFDKRENVTNAWDVDAFEDWSPTDQAHFWRILGPTCQELGYGFEGYDPNNSVRPLKTEEAQNDLPQSIVKGALIPHSRRISFKNARQVGEAIEFAAESSAYMLLGGGFWKRQNMSVVDMTEDKTNLSAEQLWSAVGGWRAKPIHVYTLRLSAEHISDTIRVICISHDENGEIVKQSDIGYLSPRSQELVLHFKPGRRAKWFNIALFVSAQKKTVRLHLKAFDLAFQKEDRRFSQTPLITLRNAKSREVDNSAAKIPIFPLKSDEQVPLWNARLIKNKSGFFVEALNKDKAFFVVYSGSTWRDANRVAYPMNSPVFMDDPSKKISLCPNIQIDNKAYRVNVFLLRYNQMGILKQSFRLGNLNYFQTQMSFTFDTSELPGSQWTVGLHAGKGQDGFRVLSP